MKKFYLANDRIFIYIVFLLIISFGCTEDPVNNRVDPFDKDHVEELINKVCKWQLNNPNARIDAPNEMWERSVFYLGVMASYRTTGNADFLNAASDWAEMQNYKLGSRDFHADDEVVGQVYLDLFMELKDSIYLSEVVAQSYAIVNHQQTGRDLWNWCDALFMTPPMIATVAHLKNDSEIYTKLDQKWWDVYNFLYDPEYNLFFRDGRYIDTLNSHGKKIFWSRGNGWVIAGLARMLQYWPDSDPNKLKYIDLFKKMSASVAELQYEDGLWRTNLVDINEFPEPETSGTAFFIYAMAWGINKGILDQTAYSETLKKGWEGLVHSVSDEGILGWVQQPYHEPGVVYKNGNQEYASGALLLAAEEIYYLLEKGKL